MIRFTYIWTTEILVWLGCGLSCICCASSAFACILPEIQKNVSYLTLLPAIVAGIRLLPWQMSNFLPEIKLSGNRQQLPTTSKCFLTTIISYHTNIYRVYRVQLQATIYCLKIIIYNYLLAVAYKSCLICICMRSSSAVVRAIPMS